MKEDVRREEVDVDEGTTGGARRNYRVDRSFIETSNRWNRWPAFFPRLNLAGRWWTTVSGEYEDETDTTLIPPGTQYGGNMQQPGAEKAA